MTGGRAPVAAERWRGATPLVLTIPASAPANRRATSLLPQPYCAWMMQVARKLSGREAAQLGAPGLVVVDLADRAYSVARRSAGPSAACPLLVRHAAGE